MKRVLSPVNVARLATTASGEMKPSGGISRSRRSTRPGADDRSVGNAGNIIPSKWATRKSGADPPKNSSGRAGTFSSFDESERCVSTGNGFLTAVAIFPNSELVADIPT